MNRWPLSAVLLLTGRHWQGHKIQPAVQTGHLTAQQQCVSCFSARLYIAGAALELLWCEGYSLLFNGNRGQSGRGLKLKINNDLSPRITTRGYKLTLVHLEAVYRAVVLSHNTVYSTVVLSHNTVYSTVVLSHNTVYSTVVLSHKNNNSMSDVAIH
jgi:hypothetical protein